MAVRFRLWTVALLTSPVLFTTVPARQDTRPMEIDPGTYRLRLCAQPCGAEGWSLQPGTAPYRRSAFFTAERTGPPDIGQCK